MFVPRKNNKKNYKNGIYWFFKKNEFHQFLSFKLSDTNKTENGKKSKTQIVRKYLKNE